ncbi:MAG: nucleotidyltransferase family protein [Candidatus Cryptobacteroides sp.]
MKIAINYCKTMKSRQEYVTILKSHSAELQERFGITYLCLFGSVAKDQHKEGSDVDVFVDMPAKAYNMVAAAEYLEDLLGCEVDLIRRHNNMRPFFLNQIQKYGIDIIGTARGNS